MAPTKSFRNVNPTLGMLIVMAGCLVGATLGWAFVFMSHRSHSLGAVGVGMLVGCAVFKGATVFNDACRLVGRARKLGPVHLATDHGLNHTDDMVGTPTQADTELTHWTPASIVRVPTPPAWTSAAAPTQAAALIWAAAGTGAAMPELAWLRQPLPVLDALPQRDNDPDELEWIRRPRPASEIALDPVDLAWIDVSEPEVATVEQTRFWTWDELKPTFESPAWPPRSWDTDWVELPVAREHAPAAAPSGRAAASQPDRYVPPTYF